MTISSLKDTTETCKLNLKNELRQKLNSCIAEILNENIEKVHRVLNEVIDARFTNLIQTGDELDRSLGVFLSSLIVKPNIINKKDAHSSQIVSETNQNTNVKPVPSTNTPVDSTSDVDHNLPSPSLSQDTNQSTQESNVPLAHEDSKDLNTHKSEDKETLNTAPQQEISQEQTDPVPQQIAVNNANLSAESPVNGSSTAPSTSPNLSAPLNSPVIPEKTLTEQEHSNNSSLGNSVNNGEQSLEANENFLIDDHEVVDLKRIEAENFDDLNSQELNSSKEGSNFFDQLSPEQQLKMTSIFPNIEN